MTTYLEEIALQFNNSKEPLSSHIFILPSKRASLFLKKALLEATHHTHFAPEILSIEDFIERISDLKIASSIELLFDFYDIYLNSDIPEKETFESFSSWAGILLDDFNEIDRNLINQEMFFSYLKDIKSIEKWGVKNEPSELIKNYLTFWNSLTRLYKAFTDNALKKGKAHQGLVYREAANNMEHYTAASKEKNHIFIGFNALNKAEEVIIKELLEAGNAEVFWDAEAYFMEKNYHSASHFLRDFKTHWKYYQANPFKNISDHYTEAKNVSIIGCSRNIGQAKCVAEILESIPENKLEKTALVLADEALLMPVLNSLPANINSVNITMGLPLNLLPASSFFENIFKIHNQTENHFYYNDVLQIIEHPLCARLIPISHKLIKNEIQSRNITQINFETILKLADETEQESIHFLFSEKNTQVDQLIQNVKNLILVLKGNIENDPILLETLYAFYEVWNKLEAFNQTFNHIKTVKTLHLLFKEIITTTNLDFKGEPYKGLQIMGLLETRSLDFENVILVSVNEGVLPAGKSNRSFITYDLKKEYNLPTTKEKDAVYTYHFYRLLHRAKNISLLYNNQTSGIQAGEKSRFLLQIAYESPKNHPITEKLYTPKITIPKKKARQIEKTPQIIDKLKALASHGFSPSGLTTYIRNPIDFYDRYVLGIRDLEEIEETVAANTLGTIAHDTLQHLYEPYLNTVLTEEILKQIRKKADNRVAEEFSKTFKEGNIKSGKNRIIFEIAKRYVHNYLKQELQWVKEKNEIIITQIENKLEAELTIPELDFPVKIKGLVDRVDQFNNTTRIIDFKTGKVTQTDLNLINWEDVMTDYKYSKIIQVLCYAVMTSEQANKGNVHAGIISFKNLNAGFMPFTKKEKPREAGDTSINEEVLSQFKNELNNLILEICDPSIPFIEKEIPKNDF